MMKDSEPRKSYQTDTLYDLSGWIRNCIRELENRNYDSCRKKLAQIIKLLEEPVIIESLKELHSDLRDET
jgi:hypothetical protein